jgi:hypothetical protein
MLRIIRSTSVRLPPRGLACARGDEPVLDLFLWSE